VESDIWKDVVGYEDLFMVSNSGGVYSKRTNKKLKQHMREDGRCTIGTIIGGRKGKTVCFKVHRLVAEAFIPNPHNKPTVNHIDGNPRNNHVSNLEWATIKEQIDHAYKLGLCKQVRGTGSATHKLSQEQVDFVRSVYVKGHVKYGLRALSRGVGVHHKTLLKVINGISY
jgi:hypothetical protein